MEFKAWLGQFRHYLKEYGAEEDYINDLFKDRKGDIKLAHSNQLDPESAIFQIAKPYSEEIYELKKQEIFERYSSKHPRLYNLQHCLDVIITRLDGIHVYLQKVRPESLFLEASTFKIAGGVTVQEEAHSCEVSDGQTIGYTKLIKTLAERLKASKNKILLFSFLRSKYSIVCELLAYLSGIPLVVLETGISQDEQIHWDSLSAAMDQIPDQTQLFLMDYSEPVTPEAYMDDLFKAQEKGEFDLIIISSLTYLTGYKQGEFYKKSRSLFAQFVEQYSIEFIIQP